MTDARTRAVEALAEALNLWELRTDPETNDVGAYLGADIYENGAATVADAILLNLDANPEARAALAAWACERLHAMPSWTGNDIEKVRATQPIADETGSIDEVMGIADPPADFYDDGLRIMPAEPEPEAAPGLRAALKAALDYIIGYGPVSNERRTVVEQARQALQAQPEAPPATRDVSEAGDGDTAWLIEQGQAEGYSPPIYFAADQMGPGRHYPTWTKNANEAWRFPSEADALAFMDGQTKEVPFPGRPVQHGWFAASHATTAAATGDAAPLDVERLARAIAAVSPTGTKYPDRLAAEYERLSEPAQYAFDPDEFEAVVNDAMGLPAKTASEEES